MLNLTCNQRIRNGDDNKKLLTSRNNIGLRENVKKLARLYIAGGGMNFPTFGKFNSFSAC